MSSYQYMVRADESGFLRRPKFSVPPAGTDVGNRWRLLLAILSIGLILSATLAESSEVNGESDPVEIPAVPYITLALIRDPLIRDELKLNKTQVAEMDRAIGEVDGTFWKLRDVPVAECLSQLNSLQEKLRSRMDEHLTVSQRERFDQLVLQRRGWRALVSPEVGKQLELSTDQTARLRTIFKQMTKEHESLEKKTAEQSVRAKEQARQKQHQSDAQKFARVLTPRQSETYIKLLGTGFDFSKLKPVGCEAPELPAEHEWINSEPLKLEELKGRVVVLHFWAFGCINCIRNLPHYQKWSEDFRSDQVTVLGIHTPETRQERSIENLRQNMKERGIEYPVLFDAKSEVWSTWGNHMWPSVYLIDKQGRVRYWWYGELNWNGARGEELFRSRIKELLAEKETRKQP